ncbi:isochorismate synthase [Aureisphaera sp. CAU 1614]|uniref:Isochorismate synthase n=1 Tax=Halomarinibacterium sedimenti TaxID=2857106 RepID=A0A9X1FMP7_9FLAO|nr:isochorismate synthase [Halomarinibacterium sedimenti]MBW2937483.1 isochorismate synthase [Halomarinibacterium sedimenti]
MIPISIFEKISHQLQVKKPFIAFSLPDSEIITFYFQKSNKEIDIKENDEQGFVMHPFDESQKVYNISKSDADTIEIKINESFEEFKNIKIKVNPSEIETHKALVTKAISEIKKKRATKIVVSRVQKIALKDFKFELLLERIFSLSQNTFRYVWYHPDTSIWCGATPELLLKTEDECFHTMALAGTREYVTNSSVVGWSEKEQHEHQVVIDDIVNKLQKAVTVLKMSKSYTHRAGPVVHLRTDIRGCFKKGKASLSAIAKILHPTPAVCGTPRKVASEFIKEFENYKRELYTGYLGCIQDKSKDSFLFVNLRCMKIENNHAHIFVGGGITADSNPEAEWEETQNKMKTMLQVLQPML